MRTAIAQPNPGKNVAKSQNALSIKNTMPYNQNDFKNFTVPLPMTDQEVIPPMHVWDNIARILDEQDKQKLVGDQLASSNYTSQNFLHSKNKLAVAFAGTVLIAGLVWLLAQ